MNKLANAQSRFRSVRGASFLTHGSDNYDHKGLNKARRAIDRAMIEEELTDVKTAQVDMKWVVKAWRNDGDKWWLDGYDVVFVSDSYKLANNCCILEDETTSLTTDGRPAPMSDLKYCDVTNDVEVQWWLECQARYKAYRDQLWDDYSI